jgi:hypothetical protein
METDYWDAFICHASEDKEDFVRPLAIELSSNGLKIWYDEFSLKLDDRLSQKIDQGLKDSEYGIVVLSKSFFKKEWTQTELSALQTKSIHAGKKVVLPVWYNISKEEIASYSPLLSDTFALSNKIGIKAIASKIVTQIKKHQKPNTANAQPFIDVEKSIEPERLMIEDDYLDKILFEISNPDTCPLVLESSIKKFEKLTRDRIMVNNYKTWKIIHQLILKDNYDFTVLALITLRNIINNDKTESELIRKGMITDVDRLRELEIQHLDDRIKDDVFYVLKNLYNIIEFSSYARQRILFAIRNIHSDNSYVNYVSKFLDFFINNKGYNSEIMAELEDLMKSNDDKVGKRAQSIYDELN